jgi:hypothetical protein
MTMIQTNITMIETYQLITISDKERWNEVVKNSYIYDFYHTWYYHSLESSGEPVLFVYEHGDSYLALPLLKRGIENSEYNDFSSVYGYAGPISNLPFEDIDNDMIEGFKQSFLDYLNKNNFVSVFSRLHPVIKQNLVLDKLGGIFENGKTVAIDLQLPFDVQRLKYRKAIRQKINQLRRKGYTVKEADNKEDISEFIEIYNQNMVKVNASSYYYFTEQYFLEMLNSSEFESKLLLAYDNETIAAGALVTFSNNIMQFHLAATKNEYLYEAPMKLLIEEAGIIGKELNMHFLHLGGGVGGKEDSLFEFKSGFSDLHLNFQTWRFIVNKPVYDQLVKERCSHNPDPNNSIFPLYRNTSSN